MDIPKNRFGIPIQILMRNNRTKNNFSRGKNKHLWSLRFDLAEKLEHRSLEGVKSVTLKATFVVGNEDADTLDKHQGPIA